MEAAAAAAIAGSRLEQRRVRRRGLLAPPSCVLAASAKVQDEPDPKMNQMNPTRGHEGAWYRCSRPRDMKGPPWCHRRRGAARSGGLAAHGRRPVIHDTRIVPRLVGPLGETHRPRALPPSLECPIDVSKTPQPLEGSESARAAQAPGEGSRVSVPGLWLNDSRLFHDPGSGSLAGSLAMIPGCFMILVRDRFEFEVGRDE